MFMLNKFFIYILLLFIFIIPFGCDNNTECKSGDSKECGSSDVGQCKKGTQQCDDTGKWKSCSGNIEPAEEICDGIDNDCDGVLDGEENITQNCGLTDLGQCEFGTETCDDNGNWNGCNAIEAVLEICNRVDDDCDGVTDMDTEGFGDVCDNGLTGICYKKGVMICDLDNKTLICNALDITDLSTDEICDELDNNCDGSIDEGCECDDGDLKACGTTDIGECKLGTQNCEQGKWTECGGNVEPKTEICDGLDNDCDGIFDGSENLTEQCGVSDEGICKYGTAECDDAGNWTNCDAVFPEDEGCNEIDDNCNGVIDENCECIDGEIRICGTSDVGECKKGGQTCSNGSWDDCNGNIEPVEEICDGFDNDCDGILDGGESLSRICGSTDIGACEYGIETCDDTGKWIQCDAIIPAEEICDGLDNNCDGNIDTDIADYGDYCDNELKGICFKSGILECDLDEGALKCNAESGDDLAENEVCDSLDNDCDGETDEELLNECGGCGELIGNVGDDCDGIDGDFCTNGTWTCLEDNSGVECTNETIVDLNERCGDLIDNNCDGQTDETLCFATFPSDTGQQICSDNLQEITCPLPGEEFYGQDANYRINTMSFTDNEDGTILDNNTGILWMKCATNLIGEECSLGDAINYDWNEANTLCTSMIKGELKDWRLPSITELHSIMTYHKNENGIGVDSTYFPNIPEYPFWSSSKYAYGDGSYWVLDYSTLLLTAFRPLSLKMVICVHGTESPLLNDFTDNGDNTVTDLKTGLMWQQCVSEKHGELCNDGQQQTYSWQTALEYCKDLELAGHADWFLPNTRQLISILNYSGWTPAIDDTYFPWNGVYSIWWTSTFDEENIEKAYHIGFSGGGSGQILSRKKSDRQFIRCVRQTFIKPECEEIKDEVCNGIDDNCNGQIDELTSIDGYDCNKKGVCKDVWKSCFGVLGYQCNYNMISTYEETEVTYDGLDNDCDGETDEGLTNE